MHAAFASRSSLHVGRGRLGAFVFLVFPFSIAIAAIAAASCAGCGPLDGEGIDAGGEDAEDAGAADAGGADAGEADAGWSLRPFAAVKCSGSYSCQTPPTDVCASLLDLRVGDAFLVEYDNQGASWAAAPGVFVARFVRGVAAEDSHRATNSNGKNNTATVIFDGDCGLWGRSSYCCSDTDSRSVAITISDAGYAE